MIGSLLDRINRLIASGKFELPVCNPEIFKLQDALADNGQHAGKIEELILADQSLAADLLRMANSPFYCGLSPVTTIRNAIVRLGFAQVQRLMILGMERAKYRAHDPALDIFLKELWRHASTTAIAAQWLAKRLGMSAMEEVCFIGGLLHDIGHLVVIRAIDEIKKEEGPELSVSKELLLEILDTTHCEMGYQLLRGWNLPDEYCHIVRDHHLPDFAPEMVSLAIVRLANESSCKLGLGLHPAPELVLAATMEAGLLKAGELMLAELEVMLEDQISIYD